jgi:hypothetical protein
MSVPGQDVLRTVAVIIVFGAVVGIGTSGCSTESLPPAPYLGERALEILKVTQNFTPDIQWVGGRVAAVGVNRGDRAALDSTLVWIRRGSGNNISSIVTFDSDFDVDFVLSVGGTPQDSVFHDETYTFWIAEESVFSANLDPTAGPDGAFTQVTKKMEILLLGAQHSSIGVEFTVQRAERIISDHYLISWTPEDVQFRRLVINRGTIGAWTDHFWHIVVPETDAASISSPVIIGVPPEGAQEAAQWPDEGFMTKPPCPQFRRRYVLWAATDDWNESFLVTAPGYAQFQIRNIPDVPRPREEC